MIMKTTLLHMDTNDLSMYTGITVKCEVEARGHTEADIVMNMV